MTHKHTNSLISETSPYLLQHAHNPVNWHAWNTKALELAKKEDKPVLVSIGYSACHWCHVMEHESFEDEATANIMNDLFINIKVDREERPDVDQVYMTAVQLMTGQGGWPLNCFVLPDGRPIYGGTYFPKQQWQNILLNLADLWKNDRGKVLEYAAQLTDGVKRSELISVPKEQKEFSFDTLHETVTHWKQRFDNTEGGPNRAPKFPLPNNYQFLLRYANLTGDNELKKHVHLSLKKMAFGGIYDQLQGGFARYSTDTLWKVPHFEKMLYDNAQLISLYGEAYHTKPDLTPAYRHNDSATAGRLPSPSGEDFKYSELYKSVVYETINFIKEELTSPEGAFYSALDADSEGVEGKYYVWTVNELKEILGGRFDLAAAYYNINQLGFWEHDNYILLRDKTDQEIAEQFGLNSEQLQSEINLIKKNLLFYRSKRIKPGLDDKSLTSWNALMIQGLTDAYSVFHEEDFLKMALKNANFILDKQLKPDGNLFHSYKNGRSTINGFLEDYAFAIEAFISLYQCTFNEKWLSTAKQLMDHSIAHFYDKETGMFFFTSDQDQALIARKTETSDNVIPASCSSIAKSLFILGHYFGNTPYIGMSKKMLNNIITHIPQYGAGYSNWGMLLLYFVSPFHEVAIVGKDVNEKRAAFDKYSLPNVIFAGSPHASSLPLLENRYVKDKTLIYVCENSTCKSPVENVEEALSLIQQGL